MRLKINITGLVQGVGFRPFVFRLANELGLRGYVLNNTSGVVIEAEGEKKLLDKFLIRVDREKPDVAIIYSLQHSYLEENGYNDFNIKESDEQGQTRASILPDIAHCDECVSEVTDPKDRRFIYPFINCTNCGPRFTIIKSLPYDRKNTSMNSFTMCQECEKEYNFPADRRFHAQPDACHICGPWVSLYDCDNQLLCEREEALEKVTNLIRKGYIIAIKGVGGYHLVCDATSEETVQRLRIRKHREEKPMAVMFFDIDAIKAETHISALEERAVLSIERPIVIVKKKDAYSLADSVSPDNGTIGVFLPYTPLHHLIMKKLKSPVVATSANITDEPIAKDNSDAFLRLAKIADYHLVHNRDIVRRCDDSVVRIMAERQVPIRRSRGFVPVPVVIPFKLHSPVLALGPYMNNTIAVGVDDRIYLSQHIGDLDTPLAMEFYEGTVSDFLRLLDIKPVVVVSDMHPGYYSTKFGELYFSGNLLTVQHHFSHILSCMAENELPVDSKVIGFAFDGTGFGLDNSIWGSEVMIASYEGFERAFHLKPYRMPGGEKAVKEPLRIAISLLYETFGDEAESVPFSPLSGKEKSILMAMIKKEINSPLTSSMGRLFDGVASLVNLSHKISYHAQAAIALEQQAMKSDSNDSYKFRYGNRTIYHNSVIGGIVDDLKSGTPVDDIARKFHNSIIEMIVTIADSLRAKTGISNVALSGGVFQNHLILENSFLNLRERGFTPLIHQKVPANDGGISLGQAVYSHFYDV